jgi:alpha-1,4-digalacturonate transport system substrate-binding protein
MKKALLVILVALLALPLSTVRSQSPTELRMTYYTDGVEDKVMRDLLDRFEKANPDIKVTMDVVGYADGIQKTLPTQLAAGQGPDMARVTDLGGLSKYYLDLSDLVADPKYWEDNMGPFLDWMRPAGSKMIPGYMTQLTVTGPFINRTLFEQAGVAVPSDKSDKVTWDEWMTALTEVAKKTNTPFAMAMDRSGHRLAGPAISMGAKYFGPDGVTPDLVNDKGFRAMADKFVQWQKDGLMPPEVWIGSSGSYLAGIDLFVNAKIVMYMSGSWQISQLVTKVGDTFDWAAVPNPCGPAACTGMPGGAAIVAFKVTQHPKEVAKVMDYLASEPVLEEFFARTLFIPGHLGLAKKGIKFQTDNKNALQALSMFASQVPKLDPLSYKLQGYPYNTPLFNAIRDRLTQVMTGELSMDDAIKRMQDDIDKALAATKQ